MRSVRRWINSVATDSADGLIGGTVALQLGGVMQRLIAVATHLLLARSLGPGRFGHYVLLVSLSSLIPLVVDLGVRHTILTRFAGATGPSRQIERARLLAFALQASLLSAVFTVVIGLGLLPLVSRILYGDTALGVLAWLLSWSEILTIPYGLILAILEGARRMRSVTALEVSGELLRLAAAALGLVIFHRSVGGLVAALLIAAAAQGVLGMITTVALWRRADDLMPKPRQIWRRLGWAAAASARHLSFGLLASLSKRLDQGVSSLLMLLLGRLRGQEEVAILRIGQIIGTMPMWLIAALARNLLPVLSERHGLGDESGLRARLKAASLTAGFCSIVVAAALAVATPWLIDLVYGAAYHNAIPVARVFLVYTIVAGFSVGHSAVYFARSDLLALNLRSIGLALMVLALAPLLMQRYAAFGAALVLVFVTMIAFVVDFYRIWRRPLPDTTRH